MAGSGAEEDEAAAAVAGSAAAWKPEAEEAAGDGAERGGGGGESEDSNGEDIYEVEKILDVKSEGVSPEGGGEAWRERPKLGSGRVRPGDGAERGFGLAWLRRWRPLRWRPSPSACQACARPLGPPQLRRGTVAAWLRGG